MFSNFFTFSRRHIGINKTNINHMLKITKSNDLNKLISESTYIKIFKPIPVIKSYSEINSQNYLKQIMNKNKPNTCLIGMGYNNSILPNPIKRHVLENPQWYTAYTPYQAEISQGRLESQYNFQEIIKDLTGLPISNASLLDEASSAAEALNVCYNYYKNKKNIFICSNSIHPQVLNVIKTKAEILNVDLRIIDINTYKIPESDINNIFGFYFQYPDTYGNIVVPKELIKQAKDNNILIACSADLLSLTTLVSPKEIGVDISLGTTQRFGIPMWFGGPHPAYFAVDKKLLRYIPGRIIGKSVDLLGEEVYRLGLQTREQHIRKDTATSNICTSQSLLTNVVSFYSLYFGKEGLKDKYNKIHNNTKILDYGLRLLGFDQLNTNYFDTICIEHENCHILYDELLKRDILVRIVPNSNKIILNLDELTTKDDLIKILNIAAEVCLYNYSNSNSNTKYIELFHLEKIKHITSYITDKDININLKRKTDFFTDKIYSKYQTETELLRYIYKLSKKDYTLCNGMIPLGSCTMKLNGTTQLEPLSWESTMNVHPYSPKDYSKGYMELINKTGEYLKKITGFNNVSFHSNSGAMGEYSGLLCIRKYHEKNMNYNNISKLRDIILIPISAHGTNFASARMANLKIVKFDENMSNEEFEELVKTYKDVLAGIMITYPNTNGVFQKDVKKINDIIHKYGGLVYMDGANMNALMGLTNPAEQGADICHLNLHKTFCIPHGGGGPGMGPILCNNRLKDCLPENELQLSNYNTNYVPSKNSIGNTTSSQWSSASLLTIPYLFIKTMGNMELQNVSKIAILNSNYLKDSLKEYYTIIDVNENGRVGHEFIIDTSEFKKYNITELDISKRLIDYSFHPPTMSWPRQNVLMFEPTESESLEELDRLVEALISIRKEIEEIGNGEYTLEDNVIVNSPHSFKMINDWKYSYTPKKAFYPVDNLLQNKYEVPITRVNDKYGDKKLLNY